MGHPQTSVLGGLTLQNMVYCNLQNNYQVLQHATETHSEKKFDQLCIYRLTGLWHVTVLTLF